MRAVIQRVSEAYVEIEKLKYAEIGRGLMILLGIEESDNHEDIEWLSAKISKLRIFNDEDEVMNKSIIDVDGEIIVVSQFTLHASTKKGNRPSYIYAAKPDKAILLYEQFKKQLALDSGRAIQSGEFGAVMNVGLINDGPVTIIIDTKNKH